MGGKRLTNRTDNKMFIELSNLLGWFKMMSNNNNIITNRGSDTLSFIAYQRWAGHLFWCTRKINSNYWWPKGNWGQHATDTGVIFIKCNSLVTTSKRPPSCKQQFFRKSLTHAAAAAGPEWAHVKLKSLPLNIQFLQSFPLFLSVANVHSAITTCPDFLLFSDADSAAEWYLSISFARFCLQS